MNSWGPTASPLKAGVTGMLGTAHLSNVSAETSQRQTLIEVLSSEQQTLLPTEPAPQFLG